MFYSFKEDDESFTIMPRPGGSAILAGQVREILVVKTPVETHFTDINEEEQMELEGVISEEEKDLRILLLRRNPAMERCSLPLLTLMEGLMLDLALGRDVTWLPIGDYIATDADMVHIQGKMNYHFPTTGTELAYWDFRNMEKSPI